MNKQSLRKTWVIISLLAALGLSLGAVDSAWAQGGRGGMNANLTPEQSAQLFDLRQQFMNDTAGLRQQMMVKRTELAALWQSATPDQNQIQAQTARNQRLERSAPGEAHRLSAAEPADLSASRQGNVQDGIIPALP